MDHPAESEGASNVCGNLTPGPKVTLREAGTAAPSGAKPHHVSVPKGAVTAANTCPPGTPRPDTLLRSDGGPGPPDRNHIAFGRRNAHDAPRPQEWSEAASGHSKQARTAQPHVGTTKSRVA